jgi:DNA-binding beta-propeller fold protein YncE
VAVSPDGSAVFVTGTSARTIDSYPPLYATVAYNAATGARLWVARYYHVSRAAALAVSPDGTAVYVTGTSGFDTSTVGYATVAYHAATGARLWVARYGPRGQVSEAASVAVSPDGSTVYATGSSNKAGISGFGTVAYHAATGARVWAARYAGPFGYSAGRSVAVSPDSSRVFVTGLSATDSQALGDAFATVAYRG